MKYLIILSTTLFFASCNWAKQKTKDTINKTGEVVAKTGSEFADGVQKGVEKTFENEVAISADLFAPILLFASLSYKFHHNPIEPLSPQ